MTIVNTRKRRQVEHRPHARIRPVFKQQHQKLLHDSMHPQTPSAQITRLDLVSWMGIVFIPLLSLMVALYDGGSRPMSIVSSVSVSYACFRYPSGIS